MIFVGVPIASLLIIGHLIVALLAIAAMLREHKHQRRSVTLGIYAYVMFLSLVSVVTFLPAVGVVVAWDVAESFATVRNVAIIFFIVGLLQLLGNKRNCPIK